MKRTRVLVPVAALFLAACGGGGGEADTSGAHGAAGADTTPAPLPPGTVDTVGVGVDPPTAGGALIDTAANPGPTDTAQGTPTRP